MRTTDVGRTRPRLAETRRAPGSRTRLPLLLPARDIGLRPSVSWRGSRVALPRDFDVSFVTPEAIIGVRGFPPRVLSLARGDGRTRTLWRAAVDGSMSKVLTGDRDRLWWSLDAYQGDDQIVSWSPTEGPQQHTVDLGVRPGPTHERMQQVISVIGPGDVILRGSWWSPDAAAASEEVRYERTSGRPADWQLDGRITASRRSSLVAGISAVHGRSSCLAVHAVDDATAAWVRCFERLGRRAEIVSAQFTSDGSRLVVLVRGGRYTGPASIFHVGLDTLLVLDAEDGRIVRRVDHNFDRIVLEDDRHVVFVHQGRPDVGGTDEGPYSASLMRCDFTGSCETASPPLPAHTSTGAVFPVPRG